MRIKEVKLTNYKRFTELNILALPVEARLVLLVGPHGCGKSSVLDALLQYRGMTGGVAFNNDSNYYDKGRFCVDEKEGAMLPRNVHVDWHAFPFAQGQIAHRKAIYARSAYRNDPVLKIGNISASVPIVDERRFDRMIENDAAVTQNYQRMAGDALEMALSKGDGAMNLTQYREHMIGELRASMSRLFSAPTLVLEHLGNPLENRNFTFSKGGSTGFPYMNLSAGEKAAFDLLLDIYVKRSAYNDTVYCIDEPEVHMGVQLQGDLLEEMLRLLPGESQLWIATHSIGMMRRAFDMHRENDKEVVFLDFAEKDFDAPVTIKPSTPNRQLWRKVHAFALDDLAELTAPYRIVICEGDLTKEFDACCYRAIFEEEFPNTEFISAGSHTNVQKEEWVSLISKIAKGAKVVRVIDDDGRHDNDVKQIEGENGVRVLKRQCIEHYILDEEVIRRFFVDLEGEEKGKEIADALINIMGDSDDFKAKSSKEIKGMANHLCKEAKQRLSNPNMRKKIGLNGCSFMRDALVPFVRGTKAYDELREVIFGK